MADLKTHLRELSVAVTVGLLSKGKKFTLEELYNKNFFFMAATAIIENDVSSAISNSFENYSMELCQIIKNGYNLGKKIFESKEFKIDKDSAIYWKGNDNQKDDPIDIVIGNYNFSLKEESFILENMGLYKLINCFTGSTYKRRHIFKDYALTEYKNWFFTTWKEMTEIIKTLGGIWNISKEEKESVIKVSDTNVTFELYCDGKLISKSILPLCCTLETFEKETTSKTREQVFSKFIKNELSNNENYNREKRECAISATTKLAKELQDNLNYEAGLPRFLRIHNFEYYYAKTTATELAIYKVPSIDDFQSNIVIDSIVSSVPNKQANILTTIRNKKTGRKLVLRNECRFSHGQFNGTPEAKMYYEAGGSLLTIYETI